MKKADYVKIIIRFVLTAAAKIWRFNSRSSAAPAHTFIQLFIWFLSMKFSNQNMPAIILFWGCFIPLFKKLQCIILNIDILDLFLCLHYGAKHGKEL